MSVRVPAQTLKKESSGNSSTSVRHQENAKPIQIKCGGRIFSVASIADGRHIVSGGSERRIRRWRTQDGEQVWTPMKTGVYIYNIAVSLDEKWIVAGTEKGLVVVWSTETHEKVTEFRGHNANVFAVDISPEGSRIATGSADGTACIWSRSTGQRLLRPLVHSAGSVCATKFSPDGHRLVTATQGSVRVYTSQLGNLLTEVLVIVSSPYNQSLAWARDSERLFALSQDGDIHSVNASTGAILYKWSIHSAQATNCIALAHNERFIAASAGSSVSFWDTTTHEQIGHVTKHTGYVSCMSISSNYDLVTAGGEKIIVHSLCNILPPGYCESQGNTRLVGREIKSSDTKQENLGHIIVDPEKIIEELRNELAESQHVTSVQNKVNKLLSADLRTQKRKSENLEETVQQLRTQLTMARQEKDNLTKSLGARVEDSNRDIVGLEKIVEGLRNDLVQSRHAANREKSDLNETVRTLRARIQEQETSSMKQTNLGKTIEQLQEQLAIAQCTASREKDSFVVQLANSKQRADSFSRIIRAHEHKHQCEVLFAQGCVYEVVDSLLHMTNIMTEDVRANKLLSEWLTEFTHRCALMLESIGDDALRAERPDEALAAYSSTLLLDLSDPDTILIKWARVALASGSMQEALNAATKFKVSRFPIHRVLCDVLEEAGRFREAVECFQQMQDGLPGSPMDFHDERTQWALDFRGRCVKKLEELGDTTNKHDDAIQYYSYALSLDPTVNGIRLKRSDEVIQLNPSSHTGYEEKHTALLGMGRHKEAFEAFSVMLSTLEQSSDPEIRDATCAIQTAIERTIQDMPRMLVDTTTGYLYDKAEQAAAFQEHPVYDELRSSMTTLAQFDATRIWDEVRAFYRYVMLSHKWQLHEPTFQMVEKSSVYGLPEAPENTKLQRFCARARSLRFRWAWSDTCCVNQQDKGVLQESLVAMFKWYRGSSLTIIHLFGVLSKTQEIGCLLRSIWNTRGWTYQEYVASKAVQFYTEDWEPYLGLQIFNHKESSIILSEMEQATRFATKEVALLNPGLDKLREKLYLASQRQTAREEDMAYCLFGIFNVALPVIYGEGNHAVGRLLEHILARSENAMLLAWAGSSGDLHSYLPADLTVYNQITPPHIPSLGGAEIASKVAELRSSLPNSFPAVSYYERLFNFPSLSVVAGKLRLPGIVFPLSDLAPLADLDAAEVTVYRATTVMLGDIKIKTKDDLSGMGGLLLIHPWISSLLDQDFSSNVPQFDLPTRALRLLVMLKQPFGALLLAPSARTQYRRVATDDLIMVRVREETSLDDLMDGIRMVNIQ